MSTDERNLAIGRAVQEYAHNRAQLGALAQRAQQLGNQLDPPSEYHRCFARETSEVTSGATAVLEHLPSVDEMRELIAEMQTAVARRQQLRSILRDAGIEPKN
jgi:hypothetical protein